MVSRFDTLLYKTPPPPPAPPPFNFFLNYPLLTAFFEKYHLNEVQDKHKNKLTRESYFFMFGILQTTIHTFL